MKWQQRRNIRIFQENVRSEDGFSLRAYANTWGAREVGEADGKAATGHDEENEQKLLLAAAALIKQDHSAADMLISVFGTKDRSDVITWAEDFLGRDFHDEVNRR